MPTLTPTVFIVDHEPSVRQSLERLIHSSGWRPESFASAEDFLARPVTEGPSCVLLDDTLPDLNGPTLLSRLAADRSDMPIIMIAGHGNVPLTVQAMRAGAVEFLLKPLTNDAVLSAVRDAVEQSGMRYQRDAELRYLRARYRSLSGREREVMLLVVAGLLNKQVGGRLGISVITVKAHRGKVMRKMGADSLAELVTMAITLRLPATATTSHGQKHTQMKEVVC